MKTHNLKVFKFNYYYSISPFDIYKKELTIVGVLVNQFGFTKALGLIEAMGSRLVSSYYYNFSTRSECFFL